MHGTDAHHLMSRKHCGNVKPVTTPKDHVTYATHMIRIFARLITALP